MEPIETNAWPTSDLQEKQRAKQHKNDQNSIQAQAWRLWVADEAPAGPRGPSGCDDCSFIHDEQKWGITHARFGPMIPATLSGRSRTFRELLVPSKTFQVFSGPSRPFQDLQRPSRFFRDLPGGLLHQTLPRHPWKDVKNLMTDALSTPLQCFFSFCLLHISSWVHLITDDEKEKKRKENNRNKEGELTETIPFQVSSARCSGDSHFYITPSSHISTWTVLMTRPEIYLILINLEKNTVFVFIFLITVIPKINK